MARINLPSQRTANLPRTHEGAVARRITPFQELKRSVMCFMLWENQFYESGQDIAARIAALIPQCNFTEVAEIAKIARNKMKLRHAPLFLVRELARLRSEKFKLRHRGDDLVPDGLVADTLAEVIQRPDELAEFLAIYWKDGKVPLSAQVKKGLARAFGKFNEYSLAKYNRDGAIKLRDVMFLTHPNPLKAQRGGGHGPEAGDTVVPIELYKKLAENKLETPDTWEVALSGGADKKETFTRLIQENKLGALALLRNLRNMIQAGVDNQLIRDAITNMKTERVLPFRFIAAARYAPQFEPQLETAMFKCLEGSTKLRGTTALLVDVSGSMDSAISSKSDLQRVDAACGLAMLLREVCDNVRVLTFSTRTVEVAPRRGFALRDAIVGSQSHSSTNMAEAITYINGQSGIDRLIVISDEQAASAVPNAKADKAYMLNVASYQNGVGYGAYCHVDGWSEAVVDFITAYEAEGY
jgi:60 kDa SS-A/Ro ribonucleoprotein